MVTHIERRWCVFFLLFFFCGDSMDAWAGEGGSGSAALYCDIVSQEMSSRSKGWVYATTLPSRLDRPKCHLLLLAVLIIVIFVNFFSVLFPGKTIY